MSRRRQDDGRPHTYWDTRDLAQAQQELAAFHSFAPNNIHAEGALLGALLIDNRMIDRVAGILQPEHFYQPMHGSMYERIVMLHGKGRRVTPITLLPYFDGETIDAYDDRGQLIPKPMMIYIAELTGNSEGLAAGTALADQIVDLSLTREVIEAVREIATAAQNRDAEIDPRALLDLAEARFAAVEGMIPDKQRTGTGWAEGWDAAVQEAEDHDAGVSVSGIKIAGYSDWNDVVGLMAPGDIIMLGGRPSMGKTAVASAVAAGAAIEGHATDFLSLEMTKELVNRRILANVIFERGRTSSYDQIQKGKFTADDRAAMARNRKLIDDKPLYIDSPDEMMVEQLLPWIRARKRSWAAQGHEQKLVVIDYLERFGTQRRFDKESDRVSYISRVVKDAAKKAKVAIVLLCQLSRSVESREDKRPLLSDLRMSGSLEQDADTVVFVYRDEYYLRQTKPTKEGEKMTVWQDEMDAARDRLELYSAKRREGALLKREGYFFTNEQAIRGMSFYSTDLFNQGGADFDSGWGGEA